ncbi:type II secretion system inner membrane protein GspF [Hirschia maritima]|uniref:type II secretion system inner membrane protein GspF n=1 Tax=Hirschia maritima TaxID=1121961 RepID=UPI0003718E01|nr:type II secretion system inner membrane protein GspF [Hirschia maritima]
MAAFEYQALDQNGKKQKGVLSSDSLKSARRELRKQGLTPINVEASKEKAAKKSRGRKLTSKDSVLLTRQMAMLISSGTPVEEALAAVGDSAKKGNVRSVLADVRSNVVEGQSLSDALSSQRIAFPALYTSIVAAGETAGALDVVMGRLADYQEKSEEMRGKVISALIYPIVVGVVALMVVVALLVFVVPRVVEQFETMGQKLPLLTQTMVNISEFLQAYGLFLSAGIVVAVLVLGRMSRIESVKRRLDRFSLSLPLIGEVVRSVASARFARTFATLAASKAPVLDCLRAAKETTPNLILRDAVQQVIEDVREGGSLSQSMARTKEFPPLVTHMAAGGEASGEYGPMFEKGAEYLERDFEKTSSVALGLLEPLITVVMGGLVMIIILAIMLPILQLNSGAMI